MVAKLKYSLNKILTIMNYKVLTLWEPWATLLVNGIKKIETRPSKTNWVIDENDIFGNKIRGTYLIHSAKRWTKKQSDICLSEPFKSELQKLGIINYKSYTDLTPCINFNKLNFGHIIGSIDVVECEKIYVDCFDSIFLEYKDQEYNKYIYEPELSFGDYTTGRYAWICKNPGILRKPIPYKGGQGYYVNFKGDINKLEFL